MLAEASRIPKKMVLDAARRIANSISIQLSMCLQQQQQQRHMLASHSISLSLFSCVDSAYVCLSDWLAVPVYMSCCGMRLGFVALRVALSVERCNRYDDSLSIDNSRRQLARDLFNNVS